MIYVPKKIRKVKVFEERLFCETEASPKQKIVSVTTSNIGKTLVFFVERKTKVNAKYYCEV